MITLFNFTFALDSEQETVAKHFLSHTLSEEEVATLKQAQSDTQDSTDFTITAFVDARGLACPAPLLKSKVALRTVSNHTTNNNSAKNSALYLIASDNNTQHDIKSFCQHRKHPLLSWTTNVDTVECYHFLITAKTATIL